MAHPPTLVFTNLHVFFKHIPVSNYFVAHIEALQLIVDGMDPGFGQYGTDGNVYLIRYILTGLIPIGFQYDWEMEYGRNRSSLEETVTWMESKYYTFESV